MTDKEVAFSQEKNFSDPGAASSPDSGSDVATPDADNLLKPGELSYAEVNAGGLGRHLGLFSTTFLMYVEY